MRQDGLRTLDMSDNLSRAVSLRNREEAEANEQKLFTFAKVPPQPEFAQRQLVASVTAEARGHNILKSTKAAILLGRLLEDSPVTLRFAEQSFTITPSDKARHVAKAIGQRLAGPNTNSHSMSS